MLPLWPENACPQKWGLEEFHPLNGEQSYNDPQKALPCAEARHMTNSIYRHDRSTVVVRAEE